MGLCQLVPLVDQFAFFIIPKQTRSTIFIRSKDQSKVKRAAPSKYLKNYMMMMYGFVSTLL
jgi:hypothetical protein